MKLLAFLILVTIAFALQGPGLIPPTEDKNHDGQPSWCQNFDSKEYQKNCDCQPKMGDEECKEEDRKGESNKCSVFCRKHACKCQRDCEKTL